MSELLQDPRATEQISRPGYVFNDSKSVVDALRQHFIAQEARGIKPSEEPATIAVFNADMFPEVDEHVLDDLGLSDSDRISLDQVKDSSPDTPLYSVMLDDSEYPPVLIQRAEVNLGDAIIEVPGLPVAYAGKMVTYSAFALGADEYKRKTN